MRKIQLLALSLLSIGVLTAQTLDQAKSFYKEEQYDNAKSALLAIGKQAPSAEAAYLLGETYFKLGQTDSAQIAYQIGANLNPKYGYNFAGLGKSSLQKGDIAGAKLNFEKARKTAKKDIKLLLSVVEATVATPTKDTATAREYLTFVSDIDNKLPELHIAYGDFNLATKNTGQAINDYNNAIFYNADKEAVAYRFGNLYYRLRKYKDAESNYKKVLEANPNATLVHKKLGDLYYTFAKFPEAKASYTTYLAKVSGSESDKEKFALILFFNKNYDETEKLINEIAAGNKNNAVLYRVRAYSAYERGDFQKGIEFMNQFFAIQKPEKVIALDYEYNGKLLCQVGKEGEAITNFQKAFDIDTTKYNNIEEIAKLQMKAKRPDKAIESYTCLLKNPTQDKSALAFSLGKAYYNLGSEQKETVDSISSATKAKVLTKEASELQAASLVSFAKADSCFSIVTNLSPKFVPGYLWKARSLALLDIDAKTDNAKKAYEALVNTIQASGKADNNSLKECYLYFASYNYMQYDRENSASAKATFKQATIDNFKKVLEIDPTNKQATDALNILK